MRPDYTGPELCALTACEVVDLLKAGEVTPAELIDASMARTEATDAAITAMPVTCPERAHAHAARLADSPAEPGPGCLHGLPVSIKDLTPVGGVRFTCGTPAMADFIAPESDALVTRIEARGGIVVGKTNTPEFGAGGNTFNAVFGRGRNPWNTALNPGGSSGGAAAGLAAGQVWLAEGSDHGGSLRTPAAYCGIVGLRPSPGRAGGAGPAASFGIDGVNGPMARTVEDCALLLDTMAGYDPSHPLSIEPPRTPFRDAVRNARPPRRIAFSPDLGGFGPVDPAVRALLVAAMERMAETGTVIEEAAPDTTDLLDTYLTYRGIGQATGPGSQPEQVQAQYKQTLRENIAFGKSLTGAQMISAHHRRSAIYHRTRKFLEGYDVIACPVVGTGALKSEIEYPTEIAGQALTGYTDWLRFAFLATMCTLPAISVPVGLMPDGSPMGIQLIGQPRGEAALLATARILEQAIDFGHRPIDPVTA